MKRASILSLTAVLILQFSIPNIAFASTFNDVPYDHEYSTPISYLESKNIIQGYEDGTFRPEQTINRVEFLKIVLEGTNVELDISNETGFSDISENDWYAPYLRKAKYEGWVQGYPDRTFRPTQAINKVEALKILGEIQNWDRLDLAEVPEAAYQDTFRFIWYSPYVYFAKENEMLPKETTLLNPAEEISRGYMSNLMYLSIIKDVSNYYPDKTAEDKINEIPQLENLDSSGTIAANFFDNIILTHEIPNTFYKDEIYIIEGDIQNEGTYNTIFAFIADNTGDNSNYKHFIGQTDGMHFKIQVIFRDAGTYKLGIVPGSSGESKIAEIQVLDGVPVGGATVNNATPSDLAIKFKNDTTQSSWDGNGNNVFRVVFIQNDTVKSFFVRDQEYLDVMYKDFKTFEEGDVAFRVYGAKATSIAPLILESKWTKSNDYSFEAILHQFKISVEDAIVYNSLPEALTSPRDIYVAGTTMENIFAEGAVIKPNGITDTFEISSNGTITQYFGNDLINAISSFNFTYSPDQYGTYILEINDQGGSAILNTPVYIGTEIPLIPDFFDLQDPFETTGNLNLANARVELLSYINTQRTNHNLNTIVQDEALNTLAQNHANDMNTKNYFAHINLENQTPEDRRIAANIKTQVGENLAHSPSLYFGHQALMRSAIHRSNILNPDWDKVGLGITLDANGYLLIVEEFSNDPWTENEIEQFENDLMTTINFERSNPLKLNSDLREIARNWSNDMTSQNFFSFSSPSGITLIDTVQNAGFTEEGKAYILQEGSLNSLAEKLKEDSDIMDSIWTDAGFGMSQSEWGDLYLTVIYTYGL
ncbi:S-layer homology domain-containing protein [Patescibacteria group bacterium]|nr:S-layer homology domain-containing protein [Patescibacteria group bacterium]